MEKLEQMNEGLINLLDAIDDDRPTILRRLNPIAEGRFSTNESKADAIIERLSRD